MKVLTEADKLVTAMKDEARAEVAKLAESPGYDQLLENLIVEVSTAAERRRPAKSRRLDSATR